ncbi:hypothetical protein [Chondromyces crocatus]|uniref:Uncharacterized protein n=1 Tax=Chondromyces crocatus TaxID=52 RepID=A0A0K1EB05_CHOCO|nr:hypothetical protein [Chondromyces crocatus]AKT37867.1 uncharacterized protein CMC5_020100 [Chondromyces crocatus]
MRALCPACGFHHEVIRVLEDGHSNERREVYQVAPLETCDRAWLSDKEILEAHARFGEDAIISDDDSD